jgi:hypothetical protein
VRFVRKLTENSQNMVKMTIEKKIDIMYNKP